MKVVVKSYVGRDDYGTFKHGKVFFESLVPNEEWNKIPDELKVNLSKGYTNPACETPIKFLQGHNAHAGTFLSHTVMREYIRRVTQDVTELISAWNMELEEMQSTDEKLQHVTMDDNDDLAPGPAPSYVLPPGMVVLGIDQVEALHALLFENTPEGENGAPLFGFEDFPDESELEDFDEDED